MTRNQRRRSLQSHRDFLRREVEFRRVQQMLDERVLAARAVDAARDRDFGREYKEFPCSTCGEPIEVGKQCGDCQIESLRNREGWWEHSSVD